MSATTLPLPPAYYRVLGAAGLSNLADGIRMAALPLLATSATTDPVAVALVFAAGEAPWVVLGFWAGRLADQTDRPRLIALVTTLRVVLLLALAAVVVAGSPPVWFIAAAAFVLGAAEVLADSATETLVPSVVSTDQLDRANSRLVAAQIAGNELAGPALGGTLFAVGAAVPFFTNSTLLAVALGLLAGLPSPAAYADGGASPRLFDGVPFVRERPLLRTLVWTSALLVAVDAAWFALLVLFVGTEVGLGPAGFGMMVAVGALGGLAGAALADRHPPPSLARLGFASFALSAAALLALGSAPTVAVTLAALVVTSAAFAVWNVAVASARQRATPNHLLGRVGATFRTAVVLASLVGSLAGGLIADRFSIRGALVGYGVLLLVAAPFVGLALRRAAGQSRPPAADDRPTSQRGR